MMPYRYLSIEREGVLLHFINAVSKKEVSFGTIFIIDLLFSIKILYFKIFMIDRYSIEAIQTTVEEYKILCME